MMGSSCQQACTFAGCIPNVLFYLSTCFLLFICVLFQGRSGKDPENSDGGGKEIRVQHKATFFKLATEIKNSAHEGSYSIFFGKKKTKKRRTCSPTKSNTAPN